MLLQHLRRKNNGYQRAILTGMVAFGVYFCMYAFRKPFTVAAFEARDVFGLDYKVLLIFSQVLGYATSKFLGIRIISEMQPGRRAWWILGCMAFAGMSLLAFALIPPPFNLMCMYLNGLPLGLIWGLVFSYLEGRQFTEIMAAILSSSFILASGMVKSTGAWLMLEFGTSAFWMPVLVGSLFLLPLLGLVLLLNRTRPPTPEDLQLRHARVPMTRKDRSMLFKSMAPGLTVFILLYMVITAFRDFRDNFALEVWADLGVRDNPSIFTQSELPITLLILVVFGGFFLIRDNFRAFRGLNWMIFAGLAIIGLNNLVFDIGLMNSPWLWTILTGTGLYLAYFPYNSMLFERLLATSQGSGNAGFLIYLADAFGYLGSMLILVFKEFFSSDMQYFDFFIRTGYLLSLAGVSGILFTHFYFNRKWRLERAAEPRILQDKPDKNLK